MLRHVSAPTGLLFGFRNSGPGVDLGKEKKTHEYNRRKERNSEPGPRDGGGGLQGGWPVLSACGGPGEGDSNLKEHVQSRGCPQKEGIVPSGRLGLSEM